MNYWKYLEVDNWQDIAQKVYKHANINLKNCKFRNTLDLTALKQKVPELFASLAKYGEINQVIVIVANTTTITLHTDSVKSIQHTKAVPKVPVYNQARLQIPVLNTEGTKTCFYDLSGIAPKMVVNIAPLFPDILVPTWDSNVLKMAEPKASVEVDRPVILRLNEPHYVYCNKYVTRVTLSIGLSPDLVHYL